YFQRFNQSVVHHTARPTLDLLVANAKSYVARADFTERVGGRAAAGAAEGNIVYVGGGIRNADYSDYVGTHPEGNIVLIAGPTNGDPVDAAIRAGAKGVILVTPANADVGIIKFSAIAAFERDTLP